MILSVSCLIKRVRLVTRFVSLRHMMSYSKGTKAEFLDHAFFSSPFGQGARRCPGSRVARNESMALLAQCVLDWKMSIPSVSHYQEVATGLDTLFTPRLPPFEFQARSG
jgi:hypothetical protein